MSNNKVAIYIRVSTQMQIDKDSLPMQRKDLSAYCELMLNTTNYEIFEDAGYSGKNTSRPEYQRMMSSLRAGGFTHLLVWKIDRISRNLLDFASMYEEIKSLGITFVSKNEQFDTSTAMGEAMLKIILVFAELERKMTSERVTATMISRANNGQWNGGRVPFGYDYDPISHEFTVNESEAATVRFMHDWYEQERSLIRLARTLNSSGSRTRLGYEWSPTTIDIILRNVFYCGDYQYNVRKEGNRQSMKSESEWVTISDHHPFIISRDQKQRIISYLNEKRPNNSYNVRHVHVFGGLLFCGYCGSMMYSFPVGKRDGWPHSTYHCGTRRKKNSCIQPSISDTKVGEFVFNIILNLLNAQASFTNDTSVTELQQSILRGNTFKGLFIDPEDLENLRCLLLSGRLKGSIYGKAENAVPKAKYDVSKLKAHRQKSLRALDRLQSLYLYSDSAMSEKDYLIQREAIQKDLDEIDQQLHVEDTDDFFIQQSSEFIIAKNLEGRNYIYYKRLAQSVDQKVLQTFVSQVLDRIVVQDDSITEITFKNGIHLTIKKEL